MKQKLLLLGASMVLLGTVAFGGAFSFPEFNDSATVGDVGVYAPSGPDITLERVTDTIPADGDFHITDDILVSSIDANYTFELVSLSITGPTFSNNCGDVDFALDEEGSDTGTTGTLVPPLTEDEQIGSVYLSISPTDTNQFCDVIGGQVNAVFVVDGDETNVDD